MNTLLHKINLYILSLGLLFVFIIIITLEPPGHRPAWDSLNDWSDLAKANVVPIISLLLIAYCGFALAVFRYELRGATHIPFEIQKIENVDYEHLTFLATYVVPLISFDFESWRQLIVLGLLLIAMGAIYVRTDLFYGPSGFLMGKHSAHRNKRRSRF